MICQPKLDSKGLETSPSRKVKATSLKALSKAELRLNVSTCPPVARS